MFKRNEEHDHSYDEYPMTAGLVRLICSECGQVGVGLARRAESSEFAGADDSSVLDALAAV